LLKSLKNTSGFLLLEVLFAMVILGGAILVVFKSYQTSLSMVRTAQQSYQASLLIEERVGTWEKTKNEKSEISENALLGPISWQQESLPNSDSTWHLEQFYLTWGTQIPPQHLELATAILN